VAAREFLTFTLGAEEYGVEILKVQEIRGYDTVTRIPDAPDFIKGVINLRGTIVPVVDMRLKFRLGKADYNALTVMIILTVAGRVVGMVVDGVSDVVALTAEQVRPAPEFGAAVGAQFLTGIGTLDSRMLILLDIEKLMTSPDMALVRGGDDGAPALSARAIDLVQQSWAKVAAIAPQAAELFYRNLFAAEPAVRGLFKGDMEAQGRKLMHMIGVAVGKLREPAALAPALEALGRRHAGYGVRASHYPVVGAALLKTLEQGLGEAFTPEVRDSWAAVYGVLSGAMIAAAEAPAPAPLKSAA
jgi:purine-binding chemotaxis protein CheW